MNMIKCESGLKCGHAMFDLDQVSEDGTTFDHRGEPRPINWRAKKTCIDCLSAEIEQRHNNGAVDDARTWMRQNGGIAPSFLSDHSSDYSPSHDGSQ